MKHLPETLVVLLCATAVLGLIAGLPPVGHVSYDSDLELYASHETPAEDVEPYPGLLRDLGKAGPTTWLLGGLLGAGLLSMPFARGARGRLCFLLALLALLLGTGGAALALRESGSVAEVNGMSIDGTTWEIAPGVVRCFASVRLGALLAFGAAVLGIILSIREAR